MPYGESAREERHLEPIHPTEEQTALRASLSVLSLSNDTNLSTNRK